MPISNRTGQQGEGPSLKPQAWDPEAFTKTLSAVDVAADCHGGSSLSLVGRQTRSCVGGKRIW